MYQVSLGTNAQCTQVRVRRQVYFPFLLAPLLRTLIALTSRRKCDPTIFVSYKIRSLAKETPFWSAFGLWFEFAPVLARPRGEHLWTRFGSDWDGPTFVFVAHRRAQSLEWDVPDDDGDLLAGFGAQGTSIPKEDSTFEMLLLMSLDSDIQ
jgi:hypothetical protein